MKKLLPINENVPVRTYSYYGFPHSIIAAKERVNPQFVKLKIFDYDEKEWLEDWSRLQVERVGTEWSFQSKSPYLEDMNGYMCRKLKDEDYIHIQIDYQQYAHPWGAVNLFIADYKNTDFKTEDDEFICRLGNFNREGVYFRVGNIPRKLNKNIKASVVDLILSRKDNLLAVYASAGNDGKPELLCQQEYTIPQKNSIKIGIQVKENDNMYYRWLYTNFIQVSCDITDPDRKLDYFYGIMKNWKVHWANFFLNSNEISSDFVLSYGVLDFIRKNINEGKYVEAKLDQYHVVGRCEYHMEHHLHQNLIFGYDDTKKIIHLLGYADNGTLVQTYITYADFKFQMKRKHCVSDIYIVSYEQDAYALTYHEEYLLEMLRQYQGSINSSSTLNHIMEETTRKYGLSVYDELRSEIGIEAILRDKRILHLFYEHKVIMAERIKYMTYHKTFEEEIGKHAVAEYENISAMALNARNFGIKYSLNSDVEVIPLIKKLLRDMKTDEERVLKLLLG